MNFIELSSVKEVHLLVQAYKEKNKIQLSMVDKHSIVTIFLKSILNCTLSMTKHKFIYDWTLSMTELNYLSKNHTALYIDKEKAKQVLISNILHSILHDLINLSMTELEIVKHY